MKAPLAKELRKLCRWLAYAGEPIRPAVLILETPNSLVAQSRYSPLGKETVNGDGFGIGWYTADAPPGSTPHLFRSIEPAWFDENLREITDAVRAPLFFAHVRAAARPPIQKTNCHPFRYEQWLFMHNGRIADFLLLRRDLMLAVDPELFPLIRGTTDSEVIFHLAITFGLRDDPIAGMQAALQFVEEVGRAHGVGFPVQGTFAVSDGSSIWAFRYSSRGRSRTLFHSIEMNAIREMYPDVERLRVFGPRTRVIVSEPLSDLEGAYVEVPESTVAVLDTDGSFHHEPFMATATVR